MFCDAYGVTGRDGLLDTLRLRLAAENSAFARRSVDYLDDHATSWQKCIT
jgi:hypothetical protein